MKWLVLALVLIVLVVFLAVAEHGAYAGLYVGCLLVPALFLIQLIVGRILIRDTGRPGETDPPAQRQTN